MATQQEAADRLPAAQEAAKAQRAAVEASKAALQGAVDTVAGQIAAARQSVGDMEAEAAEVEDKAKIVDGASREQVRRRRRPTFGRASVGVCLLACLLAWDRAARRAVSLTRLGGLTCLLSSLAGNLHGRRPGCCTR